MRLLYILVFFIISAQAALAVCAGETKFWTNENGARGGTVSIYAKIDASVFIDESSEVCDYVEIKGNGIIAHKSKISGYAKISGNPQVLGSRIFGYAEINGSALIENSTVCQGSKINSIKVKDSEYYCPSDDPEPEHPGENGKKTLAGVDMDGDGVRDDIEILVNRELPNTVDKNFSIQRSYEKFYAKILQKQLERSTDKEANLRLEKEKTDFIHCYNPTLVGLIQIKMHNTKERVYSFIKLKGYQHGTKIEEPSQKCKTFNDFNISLSKY